MLIYPDSYGEAKPVAELIPFMLDPFLASDRSFAKAGKDGMPDVAAPPADRT
ncbi:MAG: hypothetical protein JWM91_175 [Rhodospirillales bacterium]|nr:hypothetical protein [Rhodospirillales bacterium]